MFKFKKSFKVAPGVRVNVGKKSVGISAGVKGARISTNSRSGTKLTTGIPGTGISKTSSITKKPTQTATKRATTATTATSTKATIWTNQAPKANNEQIVRQYNDQIEKLTGMHKHLTDRIDWEKRFSAPPPFQHEDQGPYYLASLKIINEYKPTLRDKLFNRVEARKSALSESLPEAKLKDQATYDNWKSSITQAEKVLNYDPNELDRLTKSRQPFKVLTDIGADVDVTYGESTVAYVEVALPDDYAPSHVVTLTSTGKLSEKQMAKGKYYQLQKEILSSMVLKISGELFNLLPLQTVIANVYANSYAVEPMEHGCIAAFTIERDKFNNVYKTDSPASEQVLFFDHQINHLKTKGFKLVQEVQI